MKLESAPSRPWTRLAALGLASLQLVVGVPLVAQAQVPKRTLWVAPLKAENVPGAGLLSEKFDDASRQQLKRSKVVVLSGTQKVTTVMAGDADPRVAQAETLRVAAREAFTAKDYKGALQKLQAALKLYEESLASVAKVHALAETLGYLAATSTALEFDADARDYFKRLIAIAPDAEPMDDFSDAAKKIFAKQRKKLLRKKKGSIKVTTTPPGASIKIDGVDYGKSPVTVKSLVRGDHYVQAELSGAGLAAQRFRVKGGKTRPLALTLAESVGPEAPQVADAVLVGQLSELARKGELGPAFKEKAEAIASQTRANCVVVGYIAPRSNNFVLTAYLYGVAEKQVAAFDLFKFRADLSSVFVQAARFASAAESACHTFPFAKAVVGNVVAAAPVVAPAPAPAPTPAPAPAPAPAPKPVPVAQGPFAVNNPPPPPPEEDDGEWHDAWWVWTIAGAVVVGGTAYGGYVLLQDDEKSETFDAQVRW